MMAFYTFEDETGLFETVLFPQAYARALPTLEWNTAILMVGIVRSEFGALSLHVEEAFGLNRPDQDGAA
jgi:DNA polymerase III alpha subunit